MACIGFSEFSEIYFKNHTLVHKRSAHNESYVLAHYRRCLGDRPLDEISPLLIEGFRAKRLERVSRATTNREHQVLKNMFNKAAEWGLFSGPNPAAKVLLLRTDNRRLRYLSSEEISRLLSAAAPRIRPIVVAALHTGMRRGELRSLERRDVDFSPGIIHVLNTKNGRPREIPLDDTLRESLARLPEHEGRLFDFRNIRKLYETAVQKADLKDVNFHTLRHTFASHLVMAGVDLRTVQELLGHRSFEMTLRYSHLSSQHKRAALTTLENRWAKAPAKDPCLPPTRGMV